MWERPEDTGREPLGRFPGLAALKIAMEPGSRENIRIQSGQLALTGAEVSASGSCGPSQMGAPLALRKGPGPK